MMKKMNKTPYTDTEIEELCELYSIHHYLWGLTNAINILKKEFNYSDVNTHIIVLRKEMNKVSKEKWDKFHVKWKESTLQAKIFKRLDEEEK